MAGRPENYRCLPDISGGKMKRGTAAGLYPTEPRAEPSRVRRENGSGRAMRGAATERKRSNRSRFSLRRKAMLAGSDGGQNGITTIYEEEN